MEYIYIVIYIYSNIYIYWCMYLLMCIYNRVNFPHVYFSGFQHCSRSHRTPFAVANSAAQCGSVFAAASSLWPRHDGCWSRDQDGHHFGESCGGGVLKHGFCWENQREICGNPWVCDLSKKMVSGRFANQFSDELFFFHEKIINWEWIWMQPGLSG